MLTWDGLIEQAKILNLPLNKQRAIVREYAQTIILKGIYQADLGKKLFFIGGTALRFAYGLKRFSEDLDFDANKNLTFMDFKQILKVCNTTLEKEGIENSTTCKEKGSLLIGQIKLTNILQNYNITKLKDEKLMIKFELNRPKWNLTAESAVINRYGYLFTAMLANKSVMFSEKIIAFLNRKRGRDIYDIIFMLQNKFPIDNHILKANGYELSTKELILNRIKSLKNNDLHYLTKQVEPFLLQEEEKDFIINSANYIKALLA
ncbi:MAG: nucleotidyl transferase AbiEii/AbiGii toxin family protein [Candidatus Omnitrophota bacterium]